VLHVMTDLVREHIRLREIARRAEALLQLFVKGEIDVDLLVFRTVERSRGRLRVAARGVGGVAEKHQLGVAVRRARLLREDVLPRLLCVVEDEGDELHFLLLFRRLRDGLIRSRALLHDGRAAVIGEKISSKDKAENGQDHCTADSQRRAADAESRRSAAIFDVRADSPWCPSHGCSLCAGRASQAVSFLS
jgi:hypothetical protein